MNGLQHFSRNMVRHGSTLTIIWLYLFFISYQMSVKIINLLQEMLTLFPNFKYRFQWTGEYFLFEDFKEMYKIFEDYILDHAKSDIPPYMSSAKEFLQLLYNSNIIVAYERSSEQFSLFHSSYREKSLTNLIPEVPIGENIRYRFHYGLYKKAKQGRF